MAIVLPRLNGRPHISLNRGYFVCVDFLGYPRGYGMTMRSAYSNWVKARAAYEVWMYRNGVRK